MEKDQTISRITAIPEWNISIDASSIGESSGIHFDSSFHLNRDFPYLRDKQESEQFEKPPMAITNSRWH